MQENSMDSSVTVLSQAQTAQVCSFRVAIAQAAAVSVEETHVFTDEYLFSVLHVTNRAFTHAVTKMARIIEWRHTYDVTNIQWDDVKSQLRSGNMYWYGYDFHHRPILWVRAKLKDWRTMSSRRDVEIRAQVYLLELGCRHFLPPGITTFTIVTDSAGLSMAQLDLRLMKGLVDVCIANYPDRIGLVHAGPLTWVLKSITSWIRPFLPVRLRTKICLMRNCVTELAKHMDSTLIPLHLGGSTIHHLGPSSLHSIQRDDNDDRMELMYMFDQQKRFMDELM